MLVIDLLGRLDHVRPAGSDAWSARCPAHDDRVSSLSVGLGGDGRVLVHCHAGCGPREICAALGLDISDLFGDERAPLPAPIERPGTVRIPDEIARTPCRVDADDVYGWRTKLLGNRRLLKRLRELKGWTPPVLEALGVGFDGWRLTFPVWSAGGELLGALRYRPGARRRKMLALPGTPRELWPPPEFVPGDLLFVVEGEPDAVSAFEVGLPAVALPGAGKWHPGWARRLERDQVVVVSDCDDAGRALASRVSSEVHATILDLDPDRSDGFDLGDVVRLAAGAGMVDELRMKLLHAAGV